MTLYLFWCQIYFFPHNLINLLFLLMKYFIYVESPCVFYSIPKRFIQKQKVNVRVSSTFFLMNDEQFSQEQIQDTQTCTDLTEVASNCVDSIFRFANESNLMCERNAISELLQILDNNSPIQASFFDNQPMSEYIIEGLQNQNKQNQILHLMRKFLHRSPLFARFFNDTDVIKIVLDLYNNYNSIVVEIVSSLLSAGLDIPQDFILFLLSQNGKLIDISLFESILLIIPVVLRGINPLIEERALDFMSNLPFMVTDSTRDKLEICIRSIINYQLNSDVSVLITKPNFSFSIFRHIMASHSLPVLARVLDDLTFIVLNTHNAEAIFLGHFPFHEVCNLALYDEASIQNSALNCISALI